MEHPLTGTPLGAVQTLSLDLATKIEAKLLSVDEALHELQSNEVVDAEGYTWRIDPMTQSFVRRGPGADAVWKPADPSEYAERAPQEPDEYWPQSLTVPAPTYLLPQPVPHWAQPAPDMAEAAPNSTSAAGRPMRFGESAAERNGERRNRRWPLYAVGGVTVVALVAIVAIQVSSQGKSRAEGAPTTAPTQRAMPAPNPARSVPTGLLPKVYRVPSSDRYDSVVAELTSGSVSRVVSVTEKSQYNFNNQRLYAAIYAGWVGAGLTIEPSQPVGDPSGLTATQVWELRDGSTVIAAANVTWHRASRLSSWRLVKWPEFHPTS
ncbi:hypothetical protein [Actinomadura sp. HBU206391]|uniref:hypothetical protein n=1 Tax=Actinomadura sp. HBU206391 TaxID=2731692 RepID=UPI00165028CF|nr:hypothetical protein [Actinomadura sp. HBU206391]MBC6458097.1 hypothetical protein [Actinomadura sp. HBU206391]